MLSARPVSPVVHGSMPQGVMEQNASPARIALKGCIDLDAVGIVKGLVCFARLAQQVRTIIIVVGWIQGLVSAVLRVVLGPTVLDAQGST